MIVWSFLVLGLSAITLAQKAPGIPCVRAEGETVCLGALLSPGSVFSPKLTEIPGCFKDLSLGFKFLQIVKDCQDKNDVADSLLENGSLNPAEKMEAFNAYSTCVVENAELATFGKLVKESIQSNVLDGITGPDMLKKEHAKMILDCIPDNTTDPPSQVFMMAGLCSAEKMYKYCLEKNEPIGSLGVMMVLKSVMESASVPSNCTVDILSKIIPIIRCQIKKMSKTPGSPMTGPPKFATKISFSADPDKIALMFAKVMETLGLINDKTEVDFEVLEIFLTYLSWPNQSHKKEVLENVKVCGKYAMSNTNLTSVERAIAFPALPWLPKVLMQIIHFNNCFLPKLANTCGLQNQLALFLFPFIEYIAPDEFTEGIIKMTKNELFEKIMNIDRPARL